MKKVFFGLWLIAALLFATNALAGYAGMIFTDTLGQEKFSPPDEQYINPTGEMRVSLTGGLDRKVAIRVLDESGEEISYEESALIEANDKIDVDGKTYYGHELTVSGPLPEGEYTFRSLILDSSGNEVAREERVITVDVTAPVIDSEIQRVADHYGWGSIDLFTSSSVSSRELRLADISDGSSGLGKAKFFTIGPDNVVRESDASLDATAGVVTIPAGVAAGPGMVPQDRQTYTIGFAISDKAGNVSVIKRQSKIDRTLPPSWIEVFDSKQGKWLSYSSGMTIYENPVKVRYVRNKQDHTAFNGTDYGWGDGSYNEQDAEHLYRVVNLHYPQSYSRFYFHTKAGEGKSYHYSSLNFTLADGVEPGPGVKNNIQHQLDIWDDDRWGGTSPRYDFPYTVDKVKMSAEVRNYDQRATLSGYPSCIIPAGQTSCIVDVSISRTTGRGYSPISWFMAKADGSFSVHGGYLYTYWDTNPPNIEVLEARPGSKTIFMRVMDYDRPNNWTRSMWDTQVFRAILSAGGTVQTLSPAKVSTPDYQTKLVEFSTQSLPDGQYALRVEAQDTYNNVAELSHPQQITVDNTKPALAVYRNGQPFNSGDVIVDLADITFTVTDAMDFSPGVKAINISGGPNADNINLAWTQQTGGAYKLEYPVMFPSIEPGDYTLTIVGTDWQNNDVTKTLAFSYEPAQVSLVEGSTRDGALTVPAIDHVFSHPNEKHAIQSEQWKFIDGTPVVGRYGVYASLHSSAKSALRVNGVTVRPGDQMVLVHPDYNFGANDSRVNIPLGAAESGREGMSSLLLNTIAPGSPVLVVNVRTWMPRASLHSASGLEVQQILENVEIDLRGDANTLCSMTTSRSQAMTSDVFSDPACFVEWTTSIPGLEQKAGGSAGFKGRAQVDAPGEYPIGFTVSLLDSDGTKILLQEGQADLKVIAPQNVSYAPDKNISSVYHKVEKINFGLKQQDGISCRLGTNPEDARASIESSSPACLLEWTNIPEGLSEEESYFSSGPSMEGTIHNQGENTLSWSVKAFSASGKEVQIASQSYTIEAKTPPVPKLKLISKMDQTESGLYVASLEGGTLGYAQVIVPSQAANVTMELDGTKNGPESVQYGSWYYFGGGDEKTYTRLARMGAGNLWEKSSVKISAYYTDLPEVKNTMELQVLRVPPEGTKVLLRSDGEALDTDGVPLKVTLGDLAEGQISFDAQKHGQWSVTLGTLKGMDFNPLMQEAPLQNGTLGATLKDVEAGRMTLVARAKVVSPDGDYERVIDSNRQYVNVFRGDEPDAEIQGNRYSGPVPYTTVLTLRMDMDSRIVLGKVNWQISEDGGESWTTLAQGRVAWRKALTFEEPGKYLLRAEVHNSKSGEVGFTESIEVTAYHVPDLKLEGTKMAFTGGQVKVAANTTINGEPVEAHVEWRTLEGDLLHVGPNYETSFSEPTVLSMEVSARMPNSPGEDRYSWERRRYYVKVHEPRPPHGRVSLPYYMETEKEYDLKGSQLFLPYQDMDPEQYQVRGEWTLPDGSTVSQLDTKYTPPDEMAEDGFAMFTFTSWIDGYRDKGTESSMTRRVKIGRYVWPEFKLHQVAYVTQAPMQATLYAMPVDFAGHLEEPEYTWSLPESAEVVSIYDRKVVANFTEPGSYDISVNIVDRRGSAADVSATVVVEPAEKFLIEPKISVSNKYNREPLTLRIWPSISGGHPYDRMHDLTYMINGEPAEAIGSLGVIKDLPAGAHVVSIEGTSRYGAKAQAEIPIAVSPNQSPYCTLSQTFYDRAINPVYVVKADCEDADGHVIGYQWEIDGKQAGTHSQVGVKAPEEGQTSVVTLRVMDDGGGEAHYETYVP